MTTHEKWLLKEAARRSGLAKLLGCSAESLPDEAVEFANLMIRFERDACASAKAPPNHKLQPCRTGAFLSDQQYCFDKGWKMGAAAVRKEISRRTGIGGKKK